MIRVSNGVDENDENDNDDGDDEKKKVANSIKL